MNLNTDNRKIASAYDLGVPCCSYISQKERSANVSMNLLSYERMARHEIGAVGRKQSILLPACSERSRSKRSRRTTFNFSLLTLNCILLLCLLFGGKAWGQETYSGFTSTSGTSGNSGESYDKLIDNNTGTKWCIVQPNDTWSNTAYIEFNSNYAFVPIGYVLTTGNDNSDYPGRNPKNWVIKGKLNSSDSWTTLVSVQNDNVLQDVNNTSYEFSLNNTNRYKYFRFEISAIQSGGVFQLSEFQFKWEPPTKIVNTPSSTDKMNWDQFVEYVNGGYSYSEKTVTLMEDISVTTMVGTYIQSPESYKPFSGTFEGQGHTVTISVSGQSRFAAPFKCVKDATISNLHTAGSIDGNDNSDGKILAGVVGVSYGTTVVRGCHSSVTITTTKGADAALSGIVAAQKGGTLTIEGCVFDGAMTGSSNTRCAGIMGYQYDNVGTCTVSNSLFAPMTLTVSQSLDDDNYPASTISRATRNPGSGNLSNCYYTQPLGREQGKRAYTVSGVSPVEVSMSGNATATYDAIGLRSYSAGLVYNGTIYGGNNDVLSLTLSGGYGGYEANHGTLSGSNNPYTLTMQAYNTEISRIYVPTYTITATASPAEGGVVTFMAGIDNGPTANTHLPTDSYYKWGLTQEIYTPAEIGGGTINSIAFYCERESNISYTRTYDIYMVHTDKSVFANGNDWIPVTNSDKVFSGTVTYTPEEWTTITFDTPFDYDGIHNLVLVIDDNNGDFTPASNYLKCRVFTPSIDGFCSMNVHKDGDDPYDPFNPSQYTAGTNSNFDDGMMKVKNLILVNGSPIRTYPQGATCTLVATANDNYHFVDWTEGGNEVSTNEVYTISNITSNHTLVAHFESPCITTISSLADWQEFCSNVNNGACNGYAGQTVYLAADINIGNNMMAGTESYPFKGSFDGQGHKLTVALTSNERYCAPFRQVENATIINLKVDGSITTSSNLAGGIVGNARLGLTLNNCLCEVNITSTGNPNDQGGLVGHAMKEASGTAYITGCAFAGEIHTSSGAGMVGWVEYHTNWAEGGTVHGKAIFEDCLFAPTVIENCTGYTYSRGRENNSNDYSVTNCYYTLPHGTAQAVQVFSVTGKDDVTVTMHDNPTIEYDVSGIKFYNRDSYKGIEFKGSVYGRYDDNLPLYLNHNGSDELMGYRASVADVLTGTEHTGTNDEYSIEMPSQNVYVFPVHKVISKVEPYGAGASLPQIGTVSISPATAISGETITITTNPRSGYKVLSVFTSDHAPATNTGANTYTFTMPGTEEIVTVVYAPDKPAIPIVEGTSWVDDFSAYTEGWGNKEYRSLTATTDNAWALPSTQSNVGGSYNYSPRLWKESKRLSMKAIRNTEVIAAFPEFTCNIEELEVSFSVKQEGAGKLTLGYYNSSTGVFTELNSWEWASSSSNYDTKNYSIETSETLLGSDYRLAFKWKPTAEDKTVNIDNVTVSHKCKIVDNDATGIAENDMVWHGGTTAHESDWNTSSNWLKRNGSIYSLAGDVTPSASTSVFLVSYENGCYDVTDPVLNSNATVKDLSIGANRSLDLGNYSLTVAGNFTNNGTFTAGTGSVLFTSSLAQVIGGSAATEFNNVTFNNSNAEGIIINAESPEPTIKGAATFTSGIVNGNLTFGALSTVGSTTFASHVDGRVTKLAGGSAFTFPTGNAGVLGTITANVTSNTWVRFHNVVASNDGLPADYPRWWNVADNCPGNDPQFDHVSNLEYWNINTGGLENAELMVSATSTGAHFASVTTATTGDDIYGALWQGCWSNIGGSGRISNTVESSTITISGVDIPEITTRTIPYLTLGSKSHETLLPIELVSFTATCDGRSSLINWRTASERNNEYFVLERSGDAINFAEVARIHSVAEGGNSIEPINYSYTDYDIHAGDNYYRLWQVDYDGTRTASEIIVATCVESEVGSPEVQAYPNPFSGELSLTLDNFGNRPATIEVYDMLGKLVYTQNVDSPQNDYQIVLNMSNLPAGTYNIRVRTNDFVINKNVIKS